MTKSLESTLRNTGLTQGPKRQIRSRMSENPKYKVPFARKNHHHIRLTLFLLVWPISILECLVSVTRVTAEKGRVVKRPVNGNRDFKSTYLTKQKSAYFLRDGIGQLAQIRIWASDVLSGPPGLLGQFELCNQWVQEFRVQHLLH